MLAHLCSFLWNDPCITHQSGKTIIDFGVKRSKIKVVGEGCLQICFRMITQVRMSVLFSNFNPVSPITHERPLLILGSKGQGHKLDCFCIRTPV